MAEIWLTSDWHLKHENIIKFCNRPFKNAKEMDEAVLTWHNELVKPSDHVYNLGDVTLERGSRGKWEPVKKYIQQFHGHKRLLLGNHDHFHHEFYGEVFEKIFGTWRGIENLLFSHIPIHPNSMGSARANIHGHIHDHASPEPVTYIPYSTIWNKDTPRTRARFQPYVNVCLEWTDYRPITLDEVNARVSRKIASYQEEQDDRTDGKDSTVQTGDEGTASTPAGD